MWSAIEIHYQAFANSGSLTLWLNDVQKQSLTFIDNDTRTLTEVRLGAQGVDTNTNGTIYFDDFESRRFSYIGTLTDPGVDDPQATNQPGWFARTYQYSATIPHAVTSVNPETGSADTYSYDLNGNMICRVEGGITFKQTYNAENRISTIQKLASGTCASPGNLTAHWAFAYDGDGTRVSTLNTPYVSGQPQTSVLTAYYMGGAYEVTGSAVKKYYSVAGMMVAVHDGTILQYLLTDHLGSTVAVTNSSGTLTSQQRYLPFGAPRTIPNSPILGTDFTYTGQRKLDDGMGGVMDYRARFYSPYLNHFLQPDNIIPNPANPQDYNRFSYVRNNPIKYTDPSGHNVCDEDGNCYNAQGWYRDPHASRLSAVDSYKMMIRSKFGITMKDEKENWSLKNLQTAYKTLNTINNKLNGNLRNLVRGAIFTLTDGGNSYYGATHHDGSGVTFHVANSNFIIPNTNFFHEMGHLIDVRTNSAFSKSLPKDPTWVKNGYVDSSLLLGKLKEPVQAIGMGESYDTDEYWADAFANYMADNINLEEPSGRGIKMAADVASALQPYVTP